MLTSLRSFIVIIISLCGAPVFAGPEPAGTRGQTYDTLTLDNPTDGDVTLLARVRTLPVSALASSSITVTDNGAAALGPETDEADRWTRPVTVKGKGRHEVFLQCATSGARPVYCTLER